MEKNSIKSKILESLRLNYKYPMVALILLDMDSLTYDYNIKILLKDQFEFAFDNGYSSKKYEVNFLKNDGSNLESVLYELNEKLYKAQLKDLYLYRKNDECSNEEFLNNSKYLSNRLFSKEYNDLTKEEKSIIFGYSSLFKYESSTQIVEDFKKFIYKNGRFPYKNEWLYNVFNYAKKVSFISEEEVKKIEQTASLYAYEKLTNFVKQEKRWPYVSEIEQIRAWNEVCYNFKKGLYNEEQLINLDILYSKYNNENDSVGERIINSYISGLGYQIEKQKTFDDLKYKRKLRFDSCIMIDNKILLVEYDGPQHFMPVDYFGGEEELKETRIRDQIKNEYCKKNEIPLLRISYKQISESEQLINDFITKNTIKKNYI